MVRLAHTVVLAPVPRPWLVDALGVLMDLAESSRTEAGYVLLPDGREVPDLRLVEGRHLRPGAVYESVAKDAGDTDDTERTDRTDDTHGTERTDGTSDAGYAKGDVRAAAGETVRVTVEEWRRTRALRLAVAASAPDGVLSAHAVLRGPDRPELVELTGRARIENVWSALSRPSGDAVLRCEDWWTAADRGRPARKAPLRARLTCGIARAELVALPRPAREDDGWEVRVTARLRGRGPLRPVTALALRLFRRPLARAWGRGLDDFAAQWNTEVPQLTALGPEDLRREIQPEPEP
ncbi:hypothetical protein [Streptomyces sp. PAL114]|uniref:hypothetical protein n=1 Tax=Streptomyces sp. PAL114 TaxID=2970893 RepID=UPI0028FDC13E|nr:hypothetical protein [Streptomyces sp. PAL114]MDU0304559.1 hypothetical protein [Streptomyces sp. PAL114]